MNRCEALICGAGVAGSLLARQLALRGVEVCVLDSKSRPRRGVCGEYLCPPGVSLLEELDLGDVLSGFEPVLGMDLVSPAGRVVRCPFPSDGAHGAGVSVDKLALVERLVENARRTGPRFEFGEEVRSIARSAEGWTVHTARGSRYETPLLVGADGRHSAVARLTGSTRAERRRRVAVRGFVSPRGVVERFGEMHLFSTGAYVGVNPIHEQEINVSLVCDPQLLREEGGARDVLRRHGLRSHLLARRYDWESLRDVRAVYPVRHRVRRIVAPGLALIGDASGFFDPLTGEGIYVALWSAHCLARQLALAGERGRPQESALREYSRLRLRHFRAKARVCRAFQSIIRRSWLCERIGALLASHPGRAQAFIGVVGNNYTPRWGLFRTLVPRPCSPPIPRGVPHSTP